MVLLVIIGLLLMRWTLSIVCLVDKLDSRVSEDMILRDEQEDRQDTDTKRRDLHTKGSQKGYTISHRFH